MTQTTRDSCTCPTKSLHAPRHVPMLFLKLSFNFIIHKLLNNLSISLPTTWVVRPRGGGEDVTVRGPGGASLRVEPLAGPP